MQSLSGMLAVDKPAGISSFAVVDHVRRALLNAFPELDPRRRGRSRRRGGPRPEKFRCGHAGTLDPMATGLLILLVGKGSRLSPFLLGMDKTYRATVRFGAATDTLDREGEVTRTAHAPKSAAEVAHLLPRFTGRISQVPPRISALKKDGKPLYQRVRDGEDVPEPEAREIEIARLELRGAHWGLPAEIDDPDGPGLLGAEGTVHQVDLEMDCSSGTYVRSLARDLGEAAGSAAHLHALRRTRIGPFAVEDAVRGAMEMPGEELAERIVSPAGALAHLPAAVLTEGEAARVRNGEQPDPAWLGRLDGEPVASGKTGPLLRLLTDAEELVAVCELDPYTGAPKLATVIPAAADAPGRGSEQEQEPCG